MAHEGPPPQERQPEPGQEQGHGEAQFEEMPVSGDGRRRRREQYVADNAFVVGDKDGAGVPVLGGIAVAHENDVLLREDARFKFYGGRDRAERARIGFGAQGIGRAGNGAGRLHNSWRQAARSKRRVHIVEDQDAEMEAALPAALLKDRSPLAFGFVLQLHGGHAECGGDTAVEQHGRVQIVVEQQHPADKQGCDDAEQDEVEHRPGEEFLVQSHAHGFFS